MWKRLSELLKTKCGECDGSGDHAVCGGYPRALPGGWCSCLESDNEGKCPACNGLKQVLKEGLPWPQTKEEFRLHSDRHPEIPAILGPYGQFRAHGPHKKSDHVHVGYQPSRPKD